MDENSSIIVDYLDNQIIILVIYQVKQKHLLVTTSLDNAQSLLSKTLSVICFSKEISLEEANSEVCGILTVTRKRTFYRLIML